MSQIRIEAHPGGYEKLLVNGEDAMGSPEGIDAMSVIHYLRWWCGHDIDVEKIYYDENGIELVKIDDGTPANQ